MGEQTNGKVSLAIWSIPRAPFQVFGIALHLIIELLAQPRQNQKLESQVSSFQFPVAKLVIFPSSDVSSGVKG